MKARSACPDPPVLGQLVLGRLSGPDAEALERHLADCPHCLAALQKLPADDELSRALRPALRPEETPLQHLAETLIPQFKRLRPRPDDTATLPPSPTLAGGDTSVDLLVGLAPAQSPDEVGRLGPYRVLGVLGRGGMGVVFRAEDPALKRVVALKVVKPGLVTSPEARARFLREAQALAALEHDHIVTVYQVGEDNGTPYLAMQLLRGETLQQRLDRSAGPLPTDEVLRIGREAAAGLAVAHGRGLIHRDIKPANLWLEDSVGRPSEPSGLTTGRVKVLDFGLVQALTGEGAEGHRPGTILGTPAYMAPEQSRGQSVDSRADLFSLGCVLYRLATGRPPFQSDDALSLMMAVALDQPPPPRQVNPKLPAALDRLITRLMSKRPEDRPASAREVEAALRKLEEARRLGPSRRRWLAATAAAVLVAAGLTAWGAAHWLPGEAPPVPPDPGEVTFDYDEPDARLALRPGGGDEVVVDARRDRAVSLPPGDYALRPVASAGKRVPWPARVLVKSGEKQTVAIRLVGEVARHREHGLPVRGVAVCPRKDGLVVLSVGDDRTLTVWAPGGREKPLALWHRDSPLRCVAVAPDGRTVATGSGDVGPRAVQVVRFWDLDTGQRLPGELKCQGQVNALAFSADGKWLLSAENDGTLLWWDRKPGVVEAEQARAHGGLGTFAVALLPDGKRALTAGGDGAVVERALPGLEPIRTLTGHTAPVRGLAVLPGGKFAASAGQDAAVRVWDLAAGTAREWAAPAPVLALAVSPDGARLLTGDADGVLRLWDLATQQEVIHFETFDGPAKGLTAVAFTPDGRRAVSGGNDGSVRLWELPK
jgi:anti-sigma factor RsiW